MPFSRNPPLASISAGREREVHHERRALARNAAHSDGAPERLHDLPDDPEAQPEPAEVLARDGALEALEDPALVLGRDPDSGVAHLVANASVVRRHRESDRLAASELEGVREQVREDLVD